MHGVSGSQMQMDPPVTADVPEDLLKLKRVKGVSSSPTGWSWPKMGHQDPQNAKESPNAQTKPEKETAAQT